MGFQCFASFMCRCDQGPYFELWASLTDGATISIIDITRNVGEPADSLALFSIPRADSGVAYKVAMAREGSLFLLTHDSVSSPSQLSVVSYDQLTGGVIWQQTSDVVLGSGEGQAGFHAGGHEPRYANGGGDGFNVRYLICVNESQVWNMNGARLLEASGVTSTAEPNWDQSGTETPGTDPRDGDSAAWIISRLASHDFPKCMAFRRRYEVQSVTYTGFTQITFAPNPITYRHNFLVAFEETLEVGIGDFNHTTGFAEDVAIIWDRVASRSSTVTKVTSTTAQPPNPTVADLSIASRATAFAPHGFSSYKGDYAAAFRWTESAPGASPGSASLLLVNGAEAWSHAGSTSRVDSLGWSMDAKSGMASAIATYTEASGPFGAQLRFAAGYDDDGFEQWKHLLPRPAYVLSTNDTWALVALTLNVATENAPDGRNWSGATLLGSPGGQLQLWMVKMDGTEWEPCRTESTETTWGNLASLVPPINLLRITPYQFPQDLVKSVDHPFGPPDDTYGTTPP